MKTMTIDELKAALATGAVHAVYDNRGPGGYGQLHIKGAKNLTIADATAGKDLPANKAAMLVFY
jgi:hypothetical protein